jgi:tetratricopeptide (TPR) repeat protein
MLKYLFVSIIAISILSAQGSDSLIGEAITLYETRHIDAANLVASRDILQGIVESEPENLQALCELAKVCYLLGDEAETKDEKLDLYNHGMDYAKKAKKIDDDSAEAHFWYLVNLGRIGQTKGILHSLGSVPEFNREVDKVLKIDPDHTGALDAQAMLYYELPGILGGNLDKSIESLNRAIALDSNYTLLYVDMAKVYIKQKEYETARWYLNRALQIEKPTYVADHVLDDKPDALELLQEIEEK